MLTVEAGVALEDMVITWPMHANTLGFFCGLASSRNDVLEDFLSILLYVGVWETFTVIRLLSQYAHIHVHMSS